MTKHTDQVSKDYDDENRTRHIFLAAGIVCAPVDGFRSGQVMQSW